jgi:formylglycine-generating enzyme required for sulfatase activity
MIKYFLLLFFSGLLFQSGFTQAVPEKFIPKENSPKVETKPVSRTEQRRLRRERKNPSESKPVVSRQQTSPTVPKKLETIFSTTEDCVLEINGKWFGNILKDEPKTIPLDFGQHKLIAQSKATREIYNTTITVLGNNQVVNLTFKEPAREEIVLEDNLEYSPISLVQSSTPNEVIKINSTAVMEPVPDYVNRSTILQTVSELTSNMVFIKGGKFAKTDLRVPKAKKLKDSIAVRNFLFSKYEVTQKQWQHVMGYNNSDNRNCSECPVENVSWNEVAEFIKIVNLNSDVKFRLPTDAEWEYAVRLDVVDYINRRGGLKYGDNVAWHFDNSERKTHPVGSKMPHASGAFDLMGNVAEWCADWYDPEYLKHSKNLINPAGPSTGTRKIVRGGAYSNKDFVEAYHRDPKEKQKTIGFRLVQY